MANIVEIMLIIVALNRYLTNCKDFLTPKNIKISSRLLERQIEEEYLHKISKLDPQDEHFQARKYSLELQNKKRAGFLLFYGKVKTKNTKEIQQKILNNQQKINRLKRKALIDLTNMLLVVRNSCCKEKLRRTNNEEHVFLAVRC